VDEPAVLVITSGPLHGVRVPLGAGGTTVGRQADCDGVLDDPTVSRRHAVIEPDGRGWRLRDLGSRNGTAVNGSPVAGSAPLRAGDIVSFGSVDARLETAAAPAAASAGSDFRIGDQAAGQIHNVGRDQINYVRAERESFLADIAAAKTKGRWLVSVGFLGIVAGFAMFGYGVITFINGVPTATADSFGELTPLGPDVGGVPLGAIGFGLGALGSFLLIAGIVLHVSAAAKLRRLQNPR